jgi:predicted NBD/HSP70 family sugar kinase
MRIALPPWTPDAGPTNAVALEVLLNGPISRSEIARRLDLSPGSLTRLSTPLIESGLLVEVGERTDGGVGRPSRLLDIVPESRCFLGLKLTGDGVLGAATDLRGGVLATGSARLHSREPDAVVESIAGLVETLSADVPPVTAVGIGVGALVGAHGRIRSAPFLGWKDVELGALLEARIGLPTVIANDVTAFTEYENWFGAARGIDRFAVVTLGAGVGYGLVVGGDVVVGPDSGIGLVGHWPLDPFGPVCAAGHRGCAQSVLTTSAIESGVSAALGRTVRYDEALDLAAAGEPAARRIVDDAGRGLGRLLAAIANLTVPELVVLGGEGVRLAEVAADAVAAGLAQDRDPRASALALATTSGDDTEWCRGAAVLAIQTYVLGRPAG